jgi:transcriptional regulator with PAS, ATPase and Fis domain
MAKLLVSWIAYNHDFIKENGLFKSINEDGPHYQFHKYLYEMGGYEKHILLYSEGKQEGFAERLGIKLRADFPGHYVEEELLPIQNVIDLNEIKTKVESFLLKHKEDEIEIFFSPGTSIMQLSWYLCHQNLKLKTRLIQTKPGYLSKDGKPELLEVQINQSETPITAILKEQGLDKKEAFESDYLLTNSLKPIYERAFLLAQTDNVTAIIRGESGTGKEHLAAYIHDNSIRKNSPFIPVNCSALAENLLESRLFGFKKGSFTGANKDSDGLFALANGGTIFLDEIGDITPMMQQALLRVLQEKEIQPIGGAPIKVDVRVIAATNAPIEDLCREGKFRWDLYYRLCVAELELPTLCERGKEELTEMMEYFIDQKKKTLYKSKKLNLTKEAKQLLLRYPFPGNIRELENIIESLYVFCPNEVASQDLPKRVKQVHAEHSLLLKDVEREHILKVLEIHNGNQRQTAITLGVAINTLKAKLKSYDIFNANELEDVN